MTSAESPPRKSRIRMLDQSVRVYQDDAELVVVQFAAAVVKGNMSTNGSVPRRPRSRVRCTRTHRSEQPQVHLSVWSDSRVHRDARPRAHMCGFAGDLTAVSFAMAMPTAPGTAQERRLQ